MTNQSRTLRVIFNFAAGPSGLRSPAILASYGGPTVALAEVGTRATCPRLAHARRGLAATLRSVSGCEGVVKGAAHLPHLLDRSAAAHPVGQQHEIAIAPGIDPERRAGEADVAESGRRHARSA